MGARVLQCPCEGDCYCVCTIYFGIHLKLGKAFDMKNCCGCSDISTSSNNHACCLLTGMKWHEWAETGSDLHAMGGGC